MKPKRRVGPSQTKWGGECGEVRLEKEDIWEVLPILLWCKGMSWIFFTTVLGTCCLALNFIV